MTKIDTQTSSITELVDAINFKGRSLLSINDLSNDQLYKLFELGKLMEPWNRPVIQLGAGPTYGTSVLPT